MLFQQTIAHAPKLLAVATQRQCFSVGAQHAEACSNNAESDSVSEPTKGSKLQLMVVMHASLAL